MTTATRPQTQPIEQNTEHPHIVRTEGIATLRGTRLPVRLVAQMHRAGDTVEDILQAYPQLEPAAVHDAISYYLDHRVELEEEIAAHRIEAVLARKGGKLDERGFVTIT
jgi:uncharacterized protein (DUF433 family)